jgi:hypothetical protein
MPQVTNAVICKGDNDAGEPVASILDRCLGLIVSGDLLPRLIEGPIRIVIVSGSKKPNFRIDRPMALGSWLEHRREQMMGSLSR